MDNKSDELNSFDNDIVPHNIIYENNSIVNEISDIESSQISQLNETKIYTSLNNVKHEISNINCRRLLTSCIKTSISNNDDNCIKNNNYCGQSLSKKLGAIALGRSHGRLKCTKKLSDLVDDDVRDNIDTINFNIKIMEDTVIKNRIKLLIPDTVEDILQSSIKNKDASFDASDEDIFASQSQPHNDNNAVNDDEINNSINNENNSQQLTPIKVSEKITDNSIIEVKKPFSLSQYVEKGFISSDSEYERICNSVEYNKFDTTDNIFENIDLIKEINNLENTPSYKVLSNILESTINNEENNNKSLTDTLSDTSLRINKNSEQLNDNVLLKKNSNENNQLNEKRRTSVRLQSKLNQLNYANKSMAMDENTSAESDCSSTSTIDIKRIKEKVKRIDKKQSISPETKKILNNLNIKLDQEPVPQHQLETYISRPPSAIIKKLFNQYEPLKKGPYLQSEDQTIINNWKSFCDTHDWDPDHLYPFLNVRIRRRMIISNDERIKFAQFLARGLPWRSLYSVYARFQLIFSNKKRGRLYTKHEDEQILIYLENETKYSEKCRKLSQLLGRSKVSIWHRYLILKNKNKKNIEIKKIVEWNGRAIERFLKHFLDVTLSDNIYELKNAIIPKVVWMKLEQKLKISYKTMMYYWLGQLHGQLFYTKPIYENDIKIMLIEYMYVKGISYKQDIAWLNVVKYFDGLTTHYISRLFCSLVHNSPMMSKKNLAEIIAWLYHKRIPQLISKRKDRYLPRLIYEKGKIKIIKDSPPSSPVYSSGKD